MTLRPEDILNLINLKVEEIKTTLPDKGRRLELQCIILTEKQWLTLLKNADFKNEAECNNANLGGIPVKFDSSLNEMKIEFIQVEKQRKYFRLKRTRKHVTPTTEPLQS